MQAPIALVAEHLGGLILQAAVRANAIVFAPPPGRLVPSVGHRLEFVALQKLVPQPTVERFDETVFPRAGGRHGNGLSPDPRQPLRQCRADELCAVVAANPPRCSTPTNHSGQHSPHVCSRQRRADVQRQALPSIFVHERQPLERSSFPGPIGDKIVGPDIVLEPSRLLCATVGAGARLGGQFPASSAAKSPSQAQFDPQSPDAFEVHAPALVNEPGVNPFVPEPRMPAGQTADRSDQSLLARTRALPVTKRRAGAVQDAASAALGDAVGFAEVVGGGTLLGRRHHFFFATSWSICRSSINSAASRLRRSTSPSSSRTRRASSTLAGS